MYISLYLAELPFLVSSIPYQVILMSDSESPWKMVLNDVHITLFGWITFFGLLHTISGDTNIRLRISLKNGFKWYMYHTIWHWITFFGLIHTILGNSDIRFQISLKNGFKWCTYHSIWLKYLFWSHPYHIRWY